MSEEEAEYELVMPFVVTKSLGGPFDDAAFVSGYRLGQLEAGLSLAATLSTVMPDLYVGSPVEEPQVDLIAMKHGYQIEVHQAGPDWAIYHFKPTEEIQ